MGDESMNVYYDQHNPSGGASGPEHNVTMKGRKLLDISGVKQVESFDNEEFLLETVKGVVSIKGRVLDLVYLDEQQGEKAKGFFSKLFK